MNRVQRREHTRSLILAVARKLFLERGYERTTMRDIASGAGRTTGSIFALYENKALLFQAVMGRKAPDVRAFLESLTNLRAMHEETPLVAPLGEIEDRAFQALWDLYGTSE